MRLINVSTYELEEFYSDIPPYAILSHTWGSDSDEISFFDVEDGHINKPGVGSLKFFGACKRATDDGLGYVWIDTCCIDKTNAVEFNEAINSMFSWYRQATVCYAYLSDVPSGSRLSAARAFSQSCWFDRGWTLQELLAPNKLIFYNSDWTALGTRAESSATIEKITGIPAMLLRGLSDLYDTSIAQRMSWAAKRKTKRGEDVAYCLLGIFNIMMPMLYGEGRERAFRRLQLEIMATSADESILAWGLHGPQNTPPNSTIGASAGALAASPFDFLESGQIVSRESDDKPAADFGAVGGHVKGCFPLSTEQATGPVFILNCGPENDSSVVIGIPIQQKSADDFIRPQGRRPVLLSRQTPTRTPEVPMSISMVRQIDSIRKSDFMNWFYIEDLFSTGLQIAEVEPAERWWKDGAMISTSQDSEKDGAVQRTWVRLESESSGSLDFVICLEFEPGSTLTQARCYLIVVPRAVAFRDAVVSLDTMAESILTSQSADDGSMGILVNVAAGVRAKQDVFVVRVDALDDLPLTTVNVTQGLRQMGHKLPSNPMSDIVSSVSVRPKAIGEETDLTRLLERLTLSKNEWTTLQATTEEDRDLESRFRLVQITSQMKDMERRVHDLSPSNSRTTIHKIMATGRAAVAVPGSDSDMYFFMGTRYIRVDVVRDVVCFDTPHEIHDIWGSLKSIGFTTVDAIFPVPGFPDDAYFFSGDLYSRINITQDLAHAENGQAIGKRWPMLWTFGFHTIDAAIPCRCGGGSCHFCFFSGTLCACISIEEGAIVAKAQDIVTKWKSLGSVGFDTITTAAVKPGTGETEAYFFSGEKYCLVDLQGDVVVGWGVQDVATTWDCLRSKGFA